MSTKVARRVITDSLALGETQIVRSVFFKFSYDVDLRISKLSKNLLLTFSILKKET